MYAFASEADAAVIQRWIGVYTNPSSPSHRASVTAVAMGAGRVDREK